MINILWAAMVLLGVIIGICTGHGAEVGEAAIDSSKEAVSLCITMLGVMALWTGIMQIARDSGLVAGLSRGLKPVLRLLFPDLPQKHPAAEYIVSNMIANILGLGWAATPMGLKAMKELAKLERERNGGVDTGRASIDMCTFLIINISSLQLIPVNIIAYRSQYGAVRPTDIVGPAIVATLCSTFAGVIFSVTARKLAARGGDGRRRRETAFPAGGSGHGDEPESAVDGRGRRQKGA